MSVFTLILASLVALEFFYIMYLETMATTSATTARVFGMYKRSWSSSQSILFSKTKEFITD